MKRVVCVGLAVLDYAFGVETLPVSPGKHFAERMEIVGGGPAANAAVTIVSLGGEAVFVGRVGDDVIAQEIRGGLTKSGVDISHVLEVPGVTSPLSAVAIDHVSERMIINYRDDRLFSAPPDEVQVAIAGADAVLADMRWPQAAQVALEAARAAEVPGVLDYDYHTAGNARSILEAASHVIFSAPALALLTGTADPEEGLRRAPKGETAWSAVTLGAGGVMWIDGDEARHLPAFEVEVVDTLGAGDVFHGAFALALAEGRAIEDAVRRSAAAAALKCTRFGGRAGIPSERELESFLHGT